jgi:hypothetical protein
MQYQTVAIGVPNLKTILINQSSSTLCTNCIWEAMGKYGHEQTLPEHHVDKFIESIR